MFLWSIMHQITCLFHLGLFDSRYTNDPYRLDLSNYVQNKIDTMNWNNSEKLLIYFRWIPPKMLLIDLHVKLL